MLDKCIRTRLNILTSGRETPELFNRNDPLEKLIKNNLCQKARREKITKTQSVSRNVLTFIRDDLPDGVVKNMFVSNGV